MNQLNQQLRDEIDALQAELRQTENKILATRWTAALLDPFEANESAFEPTETRDVVTALHHARNRLSVNSDLAGRIDSILARHATFFQQAGADDLFVSGKPEGSPPSDALVQSDSPEVPLSAADGPATQPLSGEEETEKAHRDEAESMPWPPPSEVEAPTAGQPPAETAEWPPAHDEDSATPRRQPAEADGDSGRQTDGDDSAEQPQSARVQRSSGGDGINVNPVGGKTRSPVEIFSDRISFEDMLACLDITLPDTDVALMQQKLQQRQEDGVIQALQNHDQAEGRYILVPRLSRMVSGDRAVQCTLKNLVKAYPRLFGSIHDLVPYRGEPLIESETPAAGWAIIPHESPPETRGRTYAEQNQSMRILGPGVGLPSHTVRRRTLVEAVFDMIVCRLVLNISIQHQSADWTASSTGKKRFSSVYSAEEGIRIRDFPSSTKHGFLGCCPTW